MPKYLNEKEANEVLVTLQNLNLISEHLTAAGQLAMSGGVQSGVAAIRFLASRLTKPEKKVENAK